MLKKYYWEFVTKLRMVKNRQIPAWVSYLQILLNIKLSASSKTKKIHKNLLLIAWEFPPQVTGGVYRPASFAKYISENDWNVQVLTGPTPRQTTLAGEYLLKSLPDNITINSISNEDKGPNPWFLPDIDGGIINAMAIYQVASTLITSFEPGVIIASGPPFHSFLAAKWLAETFGWQLILDYRDEWTETPFGFAKQDTVNCYWENKCLSRADQVIFTTESQLEHQIKSFSELTHAKTKVIYNGWEPNDFDNINSSARAQNNTPIIKIAFLGKLGSWCLPNEFLNTLALVLNAEPNLRNQIYVQFVGNKNKASQLAIDEFKYPNNLFSIDHIPKLEACQLMQNVDALLLINSISLHRYIPGKIYEYLATGTPILLFGEGGEMATIIKNLNAGKVVAANDISALTEALKSISISSLPLSDKRSHWIQSRTRKNQAYKLLDILNNFILPSQIR